MKSILFKIPICISLCCFFLRPLFAVEVRDILQNGRISMNLLTNNPNLILSRDDESYTPLHWAAQLGQTDVAQWLLEHKADPNAIATACNDFTPLFLTTNGTIAKLLLKYGADPKKIDSWGKTPLQNAAELGHKEVTAAILET